MKNKLVFRAADYARWNAEAERSAPRKHRLYQPITDFLAQLRTFVDQLEAFEKSTPDQSGSNRIADALDSLNSQAEALRSLQKVIEEEGLYREAADLIDAAAKNPAGKGLAGPIDALLATPLLPASLRSRLLHARIGLQQPFTSGNQLTDSAPQPPSLAVWSSRLSDQAALERQLALPY